MNWSLRKYEPMEMLPSELIIFYLEHRTICHVFQSNRRLAQELGIKSRDIAVAVYCICKLWDSEAFGVSL